MADLAIEARDLTLTYKHIRQSSVKETVEGLFKHKSKKKVHAHTALKGISFDVERGSTVGIIGKNGCGKTSLLRCLAGIYEPDTGSLKINAKDVSLLALGIGFESSMSGYKNIYMNAMLRGATKEEVDERLRDIIEFSELGEFINAPVKTYSSGMRSRLAFSIAVTFDPDILLIDEALSVGDEAFKIKSFNRMKQIINDKKHTIMIVSHNMSQLKEFCDTLFWMDDGKIVQMGNPETVIREYIKHIKE